MSKSHSKILTNLVMNKSSITDTLFQLKLLLKDLNDKTIDDWIKSELEGYKDKKDIPKYRNIRSQLFGIVQIIGIGQIQNRIMPIPVKLEHQDVLEIGITNNITSIEEWSKEDKKEKQYTLDLRIANNIAAMNIGDSCQILNAWMPLPISSTSEIVNAVKNRLIDILMELEQKYNDLDDFSIPFTDKEKEDTSKKITNIIYNDYSVKLGNDNTIKNSDIGEK